MLGRARGRRLRAVEVGDVQEVHAVDDHALFRGVLTLEHARAVGHAGVLLDHVVAGARGHVVAVGPDGGTGIVGEERPQELVPIVGTEGAGPLAHRVAHRVMARLLGDRRSTHPAAAPTAARRERIGAGHGRRRGRRFVELGRAARRAALAWAAHGRGLTGRRRRGFVGHRRDLAEDRHHDQPPVGELIVAHHGVAVVAALAGAAEPLEHVVRLHGTVEHLARGVVHRALLREDRHARVHDLHDVVGPHGQRVVGRVAQPRRALRPLKVHTKSVEAGHSRGGRARTLGALLHRARSGGRGDHRWQRIGAAPGLGRRRQRALGRHRQLERAAVVVGHQRGRRRGH